MDCKFSLIVSALLSVASCYPQAVSVGKGGVVSASFGGYHASAGLGGAAGGGGAGGGLFARAGLPDGTGAAAGLGGEAAGGAAGGAYAGAGVAGGPQAGAGLGGVASGGGVGGETVVTKTKTVSGGVGGSIHVQKPASFFDDIFNIPTSVLQAVNQLLNNKAAAGGGGLRKTVRLNFRANGGASGGATGGAFGVSSGAVSGASSGAVSGASSGAVSGASSGAVSGASSSAGVEGCINTPEGCPLTKTETIDTATSGAQLDTRLGCDNPDGCVVVKEKPVAVNSKASSSSSSSSVSVSGHSTGNVGGNKNYDAVFNVDSAVRTRATQ